jgi:hypothetical protein
LPTTVFEIEGPFETPLNWRRSCCWCTNWVLTGPRCRCLFVFVFYFCKIILTYFAVYCLFHPHTQRIEVFGLPIWGRGRKARATCTSFLTIAFMIQNFNRISLFLAAFFPD